MLIDNLTSRFLVYPYILFGFGVLVIGVGETIAKHWIIGGIFLFIAGFLFATYSGTEIETDQRLFRKYNKWFGLLKTGPWKSLDNYSGVTLVSMNKVHRMYSQSNRVNSYSEKEFRIYLVNSSKKPTISIKKCKTHKQAQISLDEFSIWLKLPVFSIKQSNS